MSNRLFQCLSPAKEEGETSQTEAIGPGGPHRRRPQQRRSRSVVSAFLSFFRSDSPDSPAAPNKDSAATSVAAAGAAAATGGSERRRRHHSAGSGRPASSRMRLKRDRCPKCHGMLPLKTPELAPVLVRPGQARRRAEVKEDSGCIMTESRNATEGVQPSGRPAATSRPEDSGNFSMSSGVNNHPELPPRPPPSLARPAMFGLYGTEFSTCVPRIPNRDAPVSNNCLPIRG